MTTATPPVKTLPEILDIIDEIPETMCGRPQPEFLYSLSRETLGPIVEIGTCAGKSTIALAYGQQITGGAPITTVDIVTHPQIDANLARAGVTTWVQRIVRQQDASAEVARAWRTPIRLLWIDGDHSYDGVRTDILAWMKFVAPGGLMAFHDYPGPGASTRQANGKRYDDVWRAIYKHVLSQPDCWRVRADRAAGSIVVFERLEAPLRRPWRWSLFTTLTPFAQLTPLVLAV